MGGTRSLTDHQHISLLGGVCSLEHTTYERIALASLVIISLTIFSLRVKHVRLSTRKQKYLESEGKISVRKKMPTVTPLSHQAALTLNEVFSIVTLCVKFKLLCINRNEFKI